MGSNARLDLPEPDRPVKTIRESRGRSSEMSLRLCSRAPRMMSWSATGGGPLGWSCGWRRSNTCSLTGTANASLPRPADTPILRGNARSAALARAAARRGRHRPGSRVLNDAMTSTGSSDLHVAVDLISDAAQRVNRTVDGFDGDDWREPSLL